MEKSRLKYDVCQSFMEPDHANDDNLENCLPFGPSGSIFSRFHQMITEGHHRS